MSGAKNLLRKPTKSRTFRQNAKYSFKIAYDQEKESREEKKNNCSTSVSTATLLLTRSVVVMATAAESALQMCTD